MDFTLEPRTAETRRSFSLVRFRGDLPEGGPSLPPGILVVLVRGELEAPGARGSEVTVPLADAPALALALEGDGLGTGSSGGEGYVLRFEPGYAEALGAGSLERAGRPRAAAARVDEAERARTICEALFPEAERADPWRETALAALLMELFSLSFRTLDAGRTRPPKTPARCAEGQGAAVDSDETPASGSTPAPVRSGAGSGGGAWRIEDAVSWAAEHCAEAHSLDFYVTRCATNPSDFSRRFKALAGCPLFEYVNRKRVERACVLLKTTGLSILEVSLAVGYNNLSFFNRYFLRLMGLQPRAWRERARK